MLISIGTFICASWNEFSYPDIKDNGNVNAVESFNRFTCRSLICVVFDDRFTCTCIVLKTQKGIAQLPFGNFPFQCHLKSIFVAQSQKSNMNMRNRRTTLYWTNHRIANYCTICRNSPLNISAENVCRLRKCSKKLYAQL